MKKIKLLLLAIAVIASYNLSAQMAVTTDGSSADPTAMLEVKSSDKGFLPPRLTTTEIGNIASPANGLFVFNITDNKAYIFVSIEQEWKEVNYGAGTIACPHNCGYAFIDDRDSKSYTTVLIGTQCWMAENLNVGNMINSTSGGTNNDGEQTDNSTIEKYCNDNNTSNCDTYGGLYQWDEMMQYTTTEGAQGICPTGWHLPTDAEWTTITDYLGGTSVAGGKMKEAGTTHWISPNTGATNSSGFTALPGGSGGNGSFGNLGFSGFWWSSTESSGVYVWYRLLGYNYDQVYRANDYKAYWKSVRCLKN